MTWKLDNVEVFPEGDQDPAITFSLNDLTDPSRIRGLRSTTTKVVNTKSLRRVIGSDRMLSGRRSTRPVLRKIDGGVEQFRAEVVAKLHDQNVAELLALGGNSSWIEWARRTKLDTFDFGYSAPVTRSMQESSWTDEDSIVTFPLINFGKLTDRLGTYDVSVETLRPGFRFARVLEEVFASIGYRVAARGRLSREWPKLGFIQPTDKVRSFSPEGGAFFAKVTPEDTDGDPEQTLATAVNTTPPTFIHFEGTSYAPPSQFSDALLAVNQYYEASFNTRLRVSLENITIRSWNPAMEGSRVSFVLWEKTQSIPLGIIESDPLISAPGTPGFPASPIVVNGTFPEAVLEAGRRVSVGLWNSNGNTGLLANVTIGYEEEGFVRFLPVLIPYVEGEPLVINTAMPSLSVLDLITGLVKNRVLVVDTDATTRTVNFFRFDDYFLRPSTAGKTRDWTDRLDTTSPPAKLVDDVPSRIRYRMEEDREDLSLAGAAAYVPAPGLGNADEEVEGYGPEIEVKVPWAPTAMGFVFDTMRVPVMLDKSADYREDSFDRTLRFLIFDGVRSDGGWTHDGVPTSTYPVAYFGWPEDDAIPVGFGNGIVFGDEVSSGTLEAYGSRAAALRRSRILQANVIIRPHEMIRFNHGIPTLFDDGSGPAWYYVQEVRNFRFRGRAISVSCLLVEIPGATAVATAVETPVAVPTYPEPVVNDPFPQPPDPCTGRWPTGNAPVEVDTMMQSSMQAFVEADPTSYPIGTRILVYDHNAGIVSATTTWETSTGLVLERTTPGAGTYGDEWLIELTSPGRIVRVLDQVGTAFEFMECVGTLGSASLYPTNQVAVGAFRKITAPASPVPTTTTVDQPKSITFADDCLSFALNEDTCGVMVIQRTSDPSPNGATWSDVGSPITLNPTGAGEGWYPGGLTTPTPKTFSIDYPAGTTYIRAKYIRGGIVQGYSPATTV